MASRLLPGGYDAEAMSSRRRFLQEAGVKFSAQPPDAPEAFKGLAENQIGHMSLPLCAAGPLRIQGDAAQGEFYVPLCTVEGTLTLSMTRGFYLTGLCGGIRTRHLGQELNRSPIFIFDHITDVAPFSKWLDENFADIKAAAESHTRHGKLLRIEPHAAHTRLILDFIYSTGDAAGQNMVTIATHEACRFIRKNYSGALRGHLLESNFSGDKNASWRNFARGRGHAVLAECLLTDRPLRRILHVNVEDFYARNIDKDIGSVLGGVHGMNAHAANALAAIYLATGQDVACVAENAACSMFFEHLPGKGILAGLKMPGATVGTVGGATRLGQQRANLEMLGCAGAGGARKFAEIVCASVLALEISLLGAIVSDEFADAHRRFGR